VVLKVYLKKVPTITRSYVNIAFGTMAVVGSGGNDFFMHRLLVMIKGKQGSRSYPCTFCYISLNYKPFNFFRGVDVGNLKECSFLLGTFVYLVVRDG